MIRVSKPAVACACALLGAHLAATLSPGAVVSSNLFITFAPLLAAVACLWRGRGQSALLGDKWRLLGVGLGIWTVGQACYTYSTLARNAVANSALPSDFWFIVYGIFVLLAVCSIGEDQDSTAILVADSAQATLAIVLVYVTLFLNGHSDLRVMQTWQLNSLYLAENAALVIATTVRLLAMPDGEDRYFHRAACTFAWLMLLVSTPLNYMDVFIQNTDGHFVEVGWQLPFLVIFVMAFSKEKASGTANPSKERTWGAMMIYNASPVLFTMCVLLLAAQLSQHRPRLGFTAVVCALSIYTFRASILQTRLRQVQANLSDTERTLRLLNSQLHEQSLIDPLTGVANRRRFEQVLGVEWNRAMRSGWPVSVVMLDIDHFKSLNDRYGHLRGDECLTEVAQMLLRDLRRGGEVLARYGGEEFVAVLPNVDLEGALQTAEAMRVRVQQLGIEHTGSPLGRLTVSLGVCSVVPGGPLSREGLVAAADLALYQAKNNGRNRVEQSDSATHRAKPPAIGEVDESLGAQLVE